MVNTAIADPLIGRVLEGRYRITGQLARGGMSTVYGAVDERLDRLVAVKVMSASLSADPAFTDRFTREARAAAKLTHLNAVSVYDQGTDQATTSSWSWSWSAAARCATCIRERGRLSPAEAVSIMEPVLAALAAAHRAGLVHRDVKPENILLSDDGVVKVADFGLARAVEADAADTGTGLMMGTVAYCSPEQISRGRTDQRSDVYSAGIVLFELLTGSPPYKGDSAVNVAYQHVHGRVPRAVDAGAGHRRRSSTSWCSGPPTATRRAAARRRRVPGRAGRRPQRPRACRSCRCPPRPRGASAPTRPRRHGRRRNTSAASAHSTDPLPASTVDTPAGRPSDDGARAARRRRS